MHRIALLIYSKLEGPGQSAVYRALMFAEELVAAGDDVAIVFDGAGTSALAELLDPAHPLHAHLQAVRAQVRGACRFCAKSYGVLQAIVNAGLPVLGEHRGHASLRQLLEEGRQIVSF